TSAAKNTANGEEHKQSIYIRQQVGNDKQHNAAGTPSTISSSTASTISGSELVGGPGGDTTTSPSSGAVAPPPRRTRRAHHVYDESTNNKIEIDSDNIETPPSIRRNVGGIGGTGAAGVTSGGSCRRLHHQSQNDSKDSHSLLANDSGKGSSAADSTGAEVLGDGQFDRFSSARRTRRFKRPIDLGASGAGSGNETTTTTATTASPSPDSLPDSAAQSPLLLATNVPTGKDNNAKHEQEQRLKRWQDKLKSSTDTTKTTGSTSLNGRESPRSHAEAVLNRASKVGRTISRISQEDVREAIRSLKSPTPERTWSPTKDIHQQHGKGAPVAHELNDEGFEETQSLVSDTPSQGKESVSSCNDYGSD
uniref:Uncharacterized protein n=1 Tax=Anopheles maculatus TaxID=74869 RepID=A0A182SPN5_9DIPT